MSQFFAGYRNLEELKAIFPIDTVKCGLTPNLDIAPAGEILAIFQDAGENRLDKFHWGLVPSWANDVSIGNGLINARAETITEKPSFRDAFKHRRCLIPAAGFYEWQSHKGRKHPLAKQTGARHHIDPTRTEAAGKARQTAFVWPENKQTSDKG